MRDGFVNYWQLVPRDNTLMIRRPRGEQMTANVLSGLKKVDCANIIE